MAAEVAPGCGEAEAHHPHPPGDAVRAGDAGRERGGVERERGHPGGGVDDADAPVGVVGVGPVGEAADQRRNRGHRPGGGEQLGAAAPGLAAEGVEGDPAAPAADRQVAEHRVEGMAEPGAAREVLQPVAGEGAVHQSPEADGDGVERLQRAEPVDGAAEHGPGLLSGRPDG